MLSYPAAIPLSTRSLNHLAGLIRTQRQMKQELRREPTTEELAKRLELPVHKVRKVMRIAMGAAS